ncbi:hypothetical protein [Stappia indica]|uniref:hypothetical protein n=1 Tax=Stappia indica TaxID=538381 RepID=UPI001CD6DDF3|nr:hypothetical protein [Stappia indica]MCA1298631.1 hypothetical protein [Stappia indica]
MTKYIIRAAMQDEANDGWIWAKGFPSRCLVRIVNPDNGYNIVCQVRDMDSGFTRKYNQPGAGRIRIRPGTDVLVMSSWYRDGLGGFDPTDRDDQRGRKSLQILPFDGFQFWAQIRAASHHPDVAVRLSARPGLSGVWLGCLGGTLGLYSAIRTEALEPALLPAMLTAVLGIGAVFIGACRGPRPPVPHKDERRRPDQD